MTQFKLHDGRELQFLDNECDSNSAVVFHHGTPGHSSMWHPWLTSLSSFGIRAFAISRPGYGESTRNIGRTVSSITADVSELLNFFGIEKFVSIGWSGGGPHSLATTFEARNVGAITLAGVGAYGVPDLNFLAGMGQENHDEFGAALEGEDVIRNWLITNASAMQKVSGDEIREAFGGLIGVADKLVLEGVYAEEMAASMRAGLEGSFDGWVDDDLVFIQDWGFKLAEITKPVHLWQGDDDFMVPHAHSFWLEKHIPTAKLRFIPGEGHISLGVNYQEEIINQAVELLK